MTSLRRRLSLNSTGNCKLGDDGRPVYTPPTRRNSTSLFADLFRLNSTVESRRRRRCALGLYRVTLLSKLDHLQELVKC